MSEIATPGVRGETVDAREAAAATEVARRLNAAHRAFATLPPYHIHVQAAIDDLDRALRTYHGDHGVAVRFERRGTELLFSGEVVASGDRKESSLAYTLAQHGVRSLELQAGIDRREVLQLLEALSVTPTGADADDDLALVLWERLCEHIAVEVVAPALNEAFAAPEPTVVDVGPGELRLRLAGRARTLPAPEGRPVMAVEGEPAQVGARDLLELRVLATREAGEAAIDTAVEGVLRMAGVASRPATAQQALELIRGSIERLLRRRAFASARRLAEQLRTAQQRAELPEEWLREVARVRVALGEPRAMAPVLTHLQSGVAPPDADLIGYLRALSRNAAAPLFACFRAGHHSEALIPALVELGGVAAIQVYAAELQSDRSSQVIAAMRLLLAIDPRASARELIAQLRHTDPLVREEALRALPRIGDERVAARALAAVTDPAREVRLVALELLSRSPAAAAFDPLMELYERSAKQELAESEEVALLEALAHCDPERAAHVLGAMLRKRGWLPGRQLVSDQQRRVARVLARVPYPPCRAVVNQLANGPKPGPIQALCAAAILERGSHPKEQP